MTTGNGILAVDFCGLTLTSPIIAASAPPTESADAMIACARAGAGAVVTKSIVDYKRSDWPDIPRRVKKGRRNDIWIQGSFASETLTLSEGVTVISRTRDAINVPIIASVGVLDPKSDAAVETAARLVAAGASMVHLDLFYLGQPRSSDESLSDLSGLLRRCRAVLPVPVGPKLNIDIPAHRFADYFDPATVDCVFLLDSIRVPPPLHADGTPAIPAWRGGIECSLFGEWQRPLSLQYARVLADAGHKELCVGGGLRGVGDVVEAIMLGAKTVQAATPIIVQGYDWIRKTNDQLADALAEQEVDLAGMTGSALLARDQSLPEAITPARAVVDYDKCIPCGVCTKLVFCPYILDRGDGRPVIDAACYGCGLCAEYCPPSRNAIRMDELG